VGAQNPGRRSHHVLFLNWRDTRNPEGGGSEVYVEQIATELVAAGNRATVLCSAHGNAPRQEQTGTGVHIVRRGGRRSVYLRAALTYVAGRFRLGPLAPRRLGRPDIVVDVCNGVPFFAPLYSGRPVIALVHHVHREQWPVVLPRHQARIGWWIESWVAPRVYRRCRYVSVSQATRSELANLGVDAGRVSVIPNGTPEVSDVSGVSVARSPTPALVVLGRLVPHKQVEVALHTVAALAGEFPELSLVVAGHGWWEPRLRDLARQLGVEQRVRFAGFVTEREKHALLAWAWLALTPSLKEGWGLTIVEAGARQTPTIAFRNAGGVTEAVVDGATGLLADDRADFTSKVRQLLADETARLAMGAAASRHAAGFSWQAAGARFHALIDDTLTSTTR
jgi:glycosyltransferase involved in cell wall biosynthesis